MSKTRWRSGLKLLVVSQDRNIQEELCRSFSYNGFSCSAIPPGSDILQKVTGETPALLIADMSIPPDPAMWKSYQRIKSELHIPLVAVISREMLGEEFIYQGIIDDFVIKPYESAELASRIKRVLSVNRMKGLDECIICGDLVIDLARCEVTLSGKVIILTFMEYELLKFLAANKGRVLTRDVLLNNVWGYDYFGGDRTVDVHIRRLRSKIEDSDHSFIETVRNIGYKFREHSINSAVIFLKQLKATMGMIKSGGV
jgi:DNA-binding response OmpR family regulator